MGDSFVTALRRRWPLVLLCLALVPAIALLLSMRQSKEYAASSGLLFQSSSPVRDVLGSFSSSASTDPARDAATHVRQLASPDVAARTAAALGAGWTAKSVARRIQIAAAGETSIATITATDRDPRVATRLANLYAQEFIALQREQVRGQALASKATMQRRVAELPPDQQESALAKALNERSLRLDVLGAAAPADVVLTQHATTPTTPSSPRTARNVAFGVVLGLVFGLALALLADRLPNRIRGSSELEQLFESPVLAELPESTAFTRRVVSLGLLPGDAGEGFRMLRTRVAAVTRTHPAGSVLFTSCDSGDGKSTVSRHFAASAAMIGVRTILVEADLRHPTVAADLGLDGAPGLADVLERDVDVHEVIQKIDVSPGDADFGGWLATGPATQALAVIPAGATRLTGPELMETARMSELLDRLTTEYELVVLDTPAALEVSDAVPLMTQVDGVIVVVRPGVTTRPRALKLRRQLAEGEAPVLGVVANRVKRPLRLLSGSTPHAAQRQNGRASGTGSRAPH